MKDDMNLLREIERYLEGEMSGQEKAVFEELRKNNPQINRQVEEQAFFLQQLQHFGQRQSLKAKMDHLHRQLDRPGHARRREHRHERFHAGADRTQARATRQMREPASHCPTPFACFE